MLFRSTAQRELSRNRVAGITLSCFLAADTAERGYEAAHDWGCRAHKYAPPGVVRTLFSTPFAPLSNAFCEQRQVALLSKVTIRAMIARCLVFVRRGTRAEEQRAEQYALLLDSVQLAAEIVEKLADGALNVPGLKSAAGLAVQIVKMAKVRPLADLASGTPLILLRRK